ncbi:MAG: tripartite tricarboxylate transporter substrate binding protein [Betaproteobacteria bacterium]|nr:MAG: tripartite tricarboxylate transporter substrate binding protein [Betaproteobacteria bacterium]
MRAMQMIIMTAALATTCSAAAQNYPVRPIRIVVVSTPGGSVDTLARTVGPKLAERWGQQVLVDNRPGAGGTIAAELVAKAPPDGYTLIMGTVASFATNVSLRKSLPYDPVLDFAPISLVATQNLMLLIHPSVPAKSVKELVALAKRQPGTLSFASAGNGTGGHLSGELFKLLAGIDMLHVPYKGVAPALVDVVSGQVSMTFASIISAMPQVKNNRLRPLAVTGAQRSRAAKELPTMIEAGVQGYESATWYGLLAPAGTPADIVTKLNAEVVAILKSPEMFDRLSKEGADPVGNSPAEFARHIQAEIEKWRKVIKAAGIRPS